MLHAFVNSNDTPLSHPLINDNTNQVLPSTSAQHTVPTKGSISNENPRRKFIFDNDCIRDILARNIEPRSKHIENCINNTLEHNRNKGKGEPKVGPKLVKIPPKWRKIAPKLPEVASEWPEIAPKGSEPPSGPTKPLILGRIIRINPKYKYSNNTFANDHQVMMNRFKVKKIVKKLVYLEEILSSSDIWQQGLFKRFVAQKLGFQNQFYNFLVNKYGIIIK